MSDESLPPKPAPATAGILLHGLSSLTPFRRPLQALLFLVALAFSLLYLIVGLARVRYPYSLDLIEDNLVMQAWRVAQNQPDYVPPNADYVPQVYMPLYTWLGGLIFKVTGPGFGPLRLFSFLCTLATALLLAWIAQRESGRHLLGLAVAGLFLAGYRLSGGWYELARVENLFVLVSLAGVATAIYSHHTTWGLLAAGALMGLSLLTKQNGMLFAAGTAVYLLINVRGRLWLYVAAFTLVGLLPLWLADLASDGWLAYYAFGVAYASPIEAGRIVDTLRRELFGAMLLLSLSLLLVLLASLRRHGPWAFMRHLLTDKPWPVFILAAVFVTIAGRATIGGARQNVIIGYAFLCLAPALLAAEMAHWPGRRQRWTQPALLLGLLLQFILTWSPQVHLALGIHNSTEFIPTAAMKTAGDNLIAHIAAIDGPVFVMMHPPYALMAGKEPGVHIQSLYHARWRARDPLPADLVARIRNHYYAAIISDESTFFEDEPALLNLLETYYTRADLPPATSPPTLSGPLVRPQSIYIPKAP